MGVFNDIKDKFDGEESGRDFDRDFSNNRSSQNFETGNDSRSQRGSGADLDRSGHGSSQSGVGGRESNPSGEGLNPQSGRPRPGDSSPQTSRSSHTSSRRKDSRSKGSAPSVANDRSDIEDLKAQNKQIIDLLKRINQNLSRL